MPSSKLLVVLLIVLCSISQSIVVINAGCVCNEPGVDQCATCLESTIVRPKPRPYGPPLALPPIGDKCWCNSLRVEPAALPKTCNKVREAMEFMAALNNLIKRKLIEVAIIAKNHGITRLRKRLDRLEDHEDSQMFHQHKTPYCKCKTKPYTEYGNALYKAPPAYGTLPAYGAPLAYDTPVYNNPPLNYYAPPAAPVYDSPPADPVSISLAVQAGKAIGVPEAKLAFGFVQKPLDGLPKVQFSDVPEENLFKLKSEVITLKKLPPAVIKPEDEPIIEEEEEDDAGAYENGIDLKLTYKQLGYETEHFINPKFRRVLPAYGYAAPPSYAVKPIYAKTKVDCGFKPGRIAPAATPKCGCPYKEY